MRRCKEFEYPTQVIEKTEIINLAKVNTQFQRLMVNCKSFCKSNNNHPKSIIDALSFYVTKTILVGPKWFWSDQVDLDLSIMIWSQSKWNGHDQNELVRSKSWFSTKMNHIWTWPFHFGRDQIIMVKSKSIWSDQNHFGPTKTVLVT